ncbi:hypothetical protein BV25DRAFT_1817867 [Artomyces pyxidatus]|uniref:Uncharacterized protein n=1 Tax=Artomyces pyxidatus TaxID=48021 RepID=A0ACB8TKF4_9AGAM|nr:hypothetical protein BV25DRAFT_1817867 [Artomyces pyxidatus]
MCWLGETKIRRPMCGHVRAMASAASGPTFRSATAQPVLRLPTLQPRLASCFPLSPRRLVKTPPTLPLSHASDDGPQRPLRAPPSRIYSDSHLVYVARIPALRSQESRGYNCLSDRVFHNLAHSSDLKRKTARNFSLYPNSANQASAIQGIEAFILLRASRYVCPAWTTMEQTPHS